MELFLLFPFVLALMGVVLGAQDRMRAAQAVALKAEVK
jgi:hypothetical protein